MEQAWFEMDDVKRRRLDNVVWIPLRSAQTINATGQINRLGYRNEFYGVASIAVPHAEREMASTLGWYELGLIRRHRGYVEREAYHPADLSYTYKGLNAVSLVLAQEGNSETLPIWHLHQDLVITLRLTREGDNWLAMDEGYIEVARLQRDELGLCVLLEIRADFLKDYLCARDMSLFVSSYRDRVEVVSDVAHIAWTEPMLRQETGGDRWEGRITPMTEGGFSAGSEAAVILMGRENIDYGEDVPTLSSTGENIVVKTWTAQRGGASCYSIQGELWRTEWVEPAQQSPRVRGDEVTPTTSFIVDAAGTRLAGRSLAAIEGWLWFRPDVIMALSHRRGGRLEMFAQELGWVTCSPTTSVVFGVNNLGLINVYAKDIAQLPEWHQRIWAGCNISPEGGVSQELLSVQAGGKPATTRAPESSLAESLKYLGDAFHAAHSVPLFRQHESAAKLLKGAHRFRVLDDSSLFALAKDLARLIAEPIDVDALQKVVPPEKNENKLGSLKSLEKVLASTIGTNDARTIMGPLFGINELRQADAHLTSSHLQPTFELAGIRRDSPLVIQGLQLLNTCVAAINSIAETFLESPRS